MMMRQVIFLEDVALDAFFAATPMHMPAAMTGRTLVVRWAFCSGVVEAVSWEWIGNLSRVIVGDGDSFGYEKQRMNDATLNEEGGWV